MTGGPGKERKKGHSFITCIMCPSLKSVRNPHHLLMSTSDTMITKDVKGKKLRLDSSACLYQNDINKQLSSPVFLKVNSIKSTLGLMADRFPDVNDLSPQRN